MIIAVPSEGASFEQRVAQVPETVARLVKLGVTVLVERGAGERAGFDDAAYVASGASVVERDELWGRAQVMPKVQPPTDEELARLARGTVLACYLPPAMVPRVAERGLSALAMERVPRTTRGQAVDALSSQATVAGYKAVILGAERLPRLLPMLTTAAGTLSPARVLVVGAGVAGLQAIATAHRLGAVVYAYDVRPAAKEQVQSLGAKFVDIEAVAAGESRGGYAKELSQGEQAQVQSALHQQVAAADLVITTAQVPNRPAPRLVTAAMVGAMRRGSVVVDIAADTGGNCELTRPGEELLTPGGVRVLGPTVLAATMPFHASQMYARNMLNLLTLCLKDGAVTLDEKDELIDAMLVTRDGTVRHAG